MKSNKCLPVSSVVSRLPEKVWGSREEAPLPLVWRRILPSLLQLQDAGAGTRLGQRPRQGVSGLPPARGSDWGRPPGWDAVVRRGLAKVSISPQSCWQALNIQSDDYYRIFVFDTPRQHIKQTHLPRVCHMLLCGTFNTFYTSMSFRESAWASRSDCSQGDRGGSVYAGHGLHCCGLSPLWVHSRPVLVSSQHDAQLFICSFYISNGLKTLLLKWCYCSSCILLNLKSQPWLT